MKDFLIFGLHVSIIFLGILFFCVFHRANNTVLPISQHPDPILREVTAPIHHIDDKVISLTENIIATLEYRTIRDLFLKRSIPKGLAAPQVGIAKKLVVCGLNGEVKVLINPEILERAGVFASREGCLSIDRGGQIVINRSAHLKVKYKGLDNRERIIIAQNEDAALLEHEIDHLNGILNIDFPDDG